MNSNSYSGMTAVKISDFNEPASSLVQIKSEDESDEEERRPDRGSTSLSTNRKRYNWDDFSERDRPPTKKRYCFAE